MKRLITIVEVSEQDVKYVKEELETTSKGQAIHWSGGDKSTWNFFFIDTEDMNNFITMFPELQYSIVGS